MHDVGGSAPSPISPIGSARIERDDGDDVVVVTHSRQAGYLVLADTYSPHWRAQIDGRAVPVYRADMMLRAVQLPAGEHRVRFVYASTALERGAALSAVALFALLLGMFATLVKSERHEQAQA